MVYENVEILHQQKIADSRHYRKKSGTIWKNIDNALTNILLVYCRLNQAMKIEGDGNRTTFIEIINHILLIKILASQFDYEHDWGK